MCNLYSMTKSAGEVARWFAANNMLEGANFGAEVYPGYPGAVIAGGKLRQMSWGFPLQLRGKQGQLLKPKPVNNARTDKLDSFFWRDSFAHRRCLIPASAWAEAEGAKGAKTRSWLSRPAAELFALAGVWRMSEEWGAVYSMVMTDARGAAAELHSRMPVLLADSDYAVWTDGSPERARSLCVPWPGDLVIERTNDGWSSGKAGQSQS